MSPVLPCVHGRVLPDGPADAVPQGLSCAARPPSETGDTKQKALALDDDLWALSSSRFKDSTPPVTDAEHDVLNLVNELLRLTEAGELFIFVLHPEVHGTNNESERTLRDRQPS